MVQSHQDQEFQGRDDEAKTARLADLAPCLLQAMPQGRLDTRRRDQAVHESDRRLRQGGYRAPVERGGFPELHLPFAEDKDRGELDPKGFEIGRDVKILVNPAKSYACRVEKYQFVDAILHRLFKIPAARYKS
ncbi:MULTISPECIES: hypothetical protein [unclassified Rhizobium]|uniref:hypothetical protein n=1 Tax=unclassified Rhizobium TaxID=2613769 RepID=UPI001ADCEDD1|nr:MULTISPECIES: hypothetical protein [unclassified Rhizobium]MBO9099418.1 hypothetical protein [Rhizobium sp. L58/93]QXZ87096.1 hypothetical protein J5287_21150 [Rhizobium sp. K1/93]QXZ92870.1 hypothetical protein J5280_19745 [Rhizobium sp. K15/93]